MFKIKIATDTVSDVRVESFLTVCQCSLCSGNLQFHSLYSWKPSYSGEFVFSSFLHYVSDVPCCLCVWVMYSCVFHVGMWGCECAHRGHGLMSCISCCCPLLLFQTGSLAEHGVHLLARRVASKLQICLSLLPRLVPFCLDFHESWSSELILSGLMLVFHWAMSPVPLCYFHPTNSHLEVLFLSNWLELILAAT